MTPAEFKARFPEFNTESDLRIQIFIDDAAPAFDVGVWDAFYPAGVANYVAHNIVLANSRVASGVSGTGSSDVTSKKVGELQIQRSESALLKSMDNIFISTPYGREYQRLQKIVCIGVLTV